MNHEDFKISTVANHDPRLVLVSADWDPEANELVTEEQPIVGWMLATKIEGWGTSCDAITIIDNSMFSSSIVLNTVTHAWYEPTGNQASGNGRDTMTEYLRQQTVKGLRAV